MVNMRVILIDDERDTIELMHCLLHKYCKQVEIIGEAVNAKDGIELILRFKPDLIFLDIMMPNISGFEMLESIGTYSFDVIFVTGHDQYGIQAVKCSALDYLLKPIDPVELKKAVGRAMVKQKYNQTQDQIANMLSILKHSGIFGHRIALPLMKELRFVNPEEIIRIEAANNYTHFYLIKNEKLIVSKGMFEFDDILEPYGIIRCHQSHMVNIKMIKSLKRQDYVNELLLEDGSNVPVSRLRLEAVKDAMIRP